MNVLFFFFFCFFFSANDPGRHRPADLPLLTVCKRVLEKFRTIYPEPLLFLFTSLTVCLGTAQILKQML